MLKMEHVNKTFSPGTLDEKHALKDVSLHVKPGDFISIIGANGAGKSTLFNAVCGVFYTDTGRIVLDGKDITEEGITERAKAGIGFAFQAPVRFKGITVYDLLRIASGKRITPAAACDYLSEVGLCARDYINREANASLSGGEMKRIEIATVLARQSRFSVFDEPEAGIDLWSFQNLIRVFRSMREKISDSSMIIISHQERILEIADEIAVLANGRIEKNGKREEIFPTLIGTEAAQDACARLK